MLYSMDLLLSLLVQADRSKWSCCRPINLQHHHPLARIKMQARGLFYTQQNNCVNTVFFAKKYVSIKLEAVIKSFKDNLFVSNNAYIFVVGIIKKNDKAI